MNKADQEYVDRLLRMIDGLERNVAGLLAENRDKRQERRLEILRLLIPVYATDPAPTIVATAQTLTAWLETTP
jgi:hypothetical protein